MPSSREDNASNLSSQHFAGDVIYSILLILSCKIARVKGYVVVVVVENCKSEQKGHTKHQALGAYIALWLYILRWREIQVQPNKA